MQSGHEQKAGLCDYVSCEARVPRDHPLRLLRAIADEALEVLSPQFEGFHAGSDRSSIAPEKLLRSLLLQAFYSIASQQQLIEQLDYNLLFRWFVGLSMEVRLHSGRRSIAVIAPLAVTTINTSILLETSDAVRR